MEDDDLDVRELNCLTYNKEWFIRYIQDEKVRPKFCPWCGQEIQAWLKQEEAIT